eukprot:6388724-Prymnesium_polylepis.1
MSALGFAALALAYAPAHNASSRVLAEQAESTLTVQNPGTPVSPGVQLICYGPYPVPGDAKSLHQMLPVVDMSIVHHMIMFGGNAPVPAGSRPRANSDYCYRGKIVFAWARTGQKTPIGLDFDSGD